MPSWKDKISSVLNWAVCFAYAGLFFSIPFSNLTLIILLICALLMVDLGIIRDSIKSSLPIQLLIGFYLLHIIGLIYTENLSYGIFVLEKKISLLLLPLLLFPAWQKLDSREKSELPFRLGIITIASSLFFLLQALLNKILCDDPRAFHPDYFASIQYVYYSIYFATGSLLMLTAMPSRLKNVKVKIPIYLLLIGYSLGMLVLTSSKTGIISYVIGLGYFLYIQLPSRRLFYASLAGVILSLSLFLAIHPATLNRFLELKKNLSVVKEDKLQNYEEFTGLNLRLYFWKSSITQLWEDNRFFAGTGTGDGQDYLNMTYQKHRLDRYGYTNYDAHSQWVTTLIQLGLLGLGILGALLGWTIYKARNLGNYELLFFIWIIFCFSFSESVLESNKGIVFFALLFSVFSPSKTKTPLPTA